MTTPYLFILRYLGLIAGFTLRLHITLSSLLLSKSFRNSGFQTYESTLTLALAFHLLDHVRTLHLLRVLVELNMSFPIPYAI
jgi:hypothetical protein